MKKNFRFAFVGAIALLGAVGISSCSSSSDEVINNPDYNAETNSVKTEFVINVTQPNERTRQSSDVVGNGAFQGINNMQLICLTAAPGTATTADNAITAAKKLSLTTYAGTPAIDGTDATNTTNSSQVYTMYIPVQTNNFLFYATARASAGTTAADKFAYGVLSNNLGTATTVTGGTGTDNIKFNLSPIISTATDVTNPQDYLKSILNAIEAVSITSSASVTWASTKDATESYYQALGNAYKQFTSQTTGTSGDVRQGSSFAVMNMVKDLFNSANDVYSNETNANAKALAEAIITTISEYFNVTTPYAWPASNPYKTVAGTYDGATFNTSPYPESQNLPAGSAVISFDSTNKFDYVNTGGMGTSAVSTAYDKFTYPSELTYYCNSGLWETSTQQTTSNYPTTSKAWATTTSWTGWTSGPVTAATRAVAMKDNITYGAAQLASTITLGATTSFTDNAYNVTNHTIANTEFSSTSTAGTITLKVHGLLVGGQPDEAQYEYLPNGVAISNVIYDRFSSEGTTLTSGDTKNYTLVLDNYTSNTTQNTVNIALEMTADKDFYGKEGMIKAGQKFYLIGSLDPTSPATGSSITWANQTSFKSTDTGYNTNRVFIRDAKTEATFKLSNTSLQKAYSTIPDLRSTQMLFGISVDLVWKAGLTFEVNL